MQNAAMMKMVGTVGVALTLFNLLFALHGMGPLDFWWGLAGNIAVLAVLALLADRKLAGRLRADVAAGVGRKLLLGMGSALALWLAFKLGFLAWRHILPAAAAQAQSVYDLRSLAATWRVVLLVALVIGPGEELFWRCFVQERLMARCGAAAGWPLAAIPYALAHVATLNPSLLIAALIAGLAWGWLYLRYRSWLLNAVSHTVWDLLVLFVFPLQ